MRIQNRRDTAANWASANTVLADGELGIEKGTCRFKIGDGVTSWSSLAYKGNDESTVELPLRNWIPVGALPNDGTVDCQSLFQGIINNLGALYIATGRMHILKLPAGTYRCDGPNALLPVSGFGVRGEGPFATKILTPTTSAWLGIAYVEGDADFKISNMLFEDFTVDGSRVPNGTSYTALYKGFSLQNIRDTTFRRVRVLNTFATGFGVDYSDRVLFDQCIADGAGRGRLTATPVVADRIGSGSGYGIGFGKHRDEHVELIGCQARNCGAAGVFGELLDRVPAIYHATGLTVIGGLYEGNAYGFNDSGTSESRFLGSVLRNNLYAGMRVGNSDPFQPGGRRGMAANLSIHGNLNGVIFEGSAEASYDLHDNEITENANNGVWFRDRAGGWIGRNVRVHHNHIHRNGGPGVFANSTNPIPELGLSDNYIHDNGQDATSTYRDEVCLLSSMVRPRIKRNRIRSRYGYALACRGAGTITHSPQITDNDYTGSAGGAEFNEHIFTGTPRNRGNIGDASLTVTQIIARPTPQTVGSWTGSLTTRSAVNSGPTVDGVPILWSYQGILTDQAARLWCPQYAVTPGDVLVASVYVNAAAGKLVRPYVRWDGTTQLAGAVNRMGGWQRMSMVVVVPPGVSTIQVGAGTSPFTGDDALWAIGDVLQITGVNVTKGSHLWPYIDGSRPNCSWDGTAFDSTSHLTIPGVLVDSGDPVPDLAVGEATMLRESVTSATISSSSSGTARFSYFTAHKTEPISAVRTVSGATALPADATLAKIGVHEVDEATGNLTLVAVTANEEATLWAAASTAYTSNFLAPFTKVAGKRYAIEFLWVGPTAGMTYVGQNSIIASEQAVAPRLTATKAAQTDIVAGTITSVSDFSGRIYAALLP